jgi:hypothetical protein
VKEFTAVIWMARQPETGQSGKRMLGYTWQRIFSNAKMSLTWQPRILLQAEQRISCEDLGLISFHELCNIE